MTDNTDRTAKEAPLNMLLISFFFDLLQNADDLFHKMRRPQHCLHHLLPPLSVWWIN